MNMKLYYRMAISCKHPAYGTQDGASFSEHSYWHKLYFDAINKQAGVMRNIDWPYVMRIQTEAVNNQGTNTGGKWTTDMFIDHDIGPFLGSDL